jgi:uncharacterized protein YacL
MVEISAVERDDWAREVVQAQRKYGRALLNDVLIASAIYVVGSAMVWWVSSMAGSTTTPFETVVRNDISPGSALAAAGVLAAVIIALQVAVRTSAPGRPHEYARARILAVVSRICGVGAMGLGIATLFHRGLTFAPYDVWGTWAPIAGAALLAVLAADASVTSSDRQDARVSDFERAMTLRRREELVGGIDWLELPARRGAFRTGQVLVALAVAVGPGVLASLWLSPWWFSPRFAFAGAVVSLILLIVFGAMSLHARLGWLRGDRLEPVLLVTLIVTVFAVYALSFVLAALEQASTVERSHQTWGLLITLLLDGITVAGAPAAAVIWQLSLAGAFGYRSVGMEFQKRSLDKEIAALAREHPRRQVAKVRAWPTLATTAALVVLAAPVAWWLSARLQRTRTWTRVESRWLTVMYFGSVTLTLSIALVAVVVARVDLA